MISLRPATVYMSMKNRGETFTDTLSFTCKGDPSSPTDPAGPDGQAVWDMSSESCTDSPWTSACNATCSGGTTASGTTTTYDSCGRPQSTNACSINCCTPVYSYSCSGASYIATDTTCGTGSHVAGTCTRTTSHGTSACDLDQDNEYSFATGCETVFWQCDSGWYCKSGDCSGTCTANACSNKPAKITCATGTTIGSTCPVNSATCSGSYWAPP